MRRRTGVTLIEVIVVIVVIGLAFLVLLMMLPRGREQARMLRCRQNLGQIGVALALYDQSHHQIPSVNRLASSSDRDASASPSPLRALLETLDQPDFSGLSDLHAPPPPARGRGGLSGEVPVAGFVCASDPNATAGLFAAPISYRATTGDAPGGETGPFATGRVVTLQTLDHADGLSFTAAFSERLVGDNQVNHEAAANYRVVAGPLTGEKCPPAEADTTWRGDAGSSWGWASYRQTLYNHSLRPNAHPSCVAADGQTANMGASSGHLRGVNLLLLDGSVTLVTRDIDLRVWKKYAN